MSWTVVADTQIGFQHVSSQKPCDDRARAFILESGMLIGAVSDGAGSASRSAIGAEMAVESALCSLQEQEWGIAPPTVEEAAAVARTAVVGAVEKLRQYAAQEACQLHDLHCTLLVVVASPQWLLAAQVGDGFIVARCRDCQDYRLLFPPTKGEYSNETEFITHESAPEGLRTTVHADPEFIFMSTDGLESSALKMENNELVPHPGFFRAFDELLAQNPDTDQCAQAVRQWLESPKLNGGWAYDDKGVLIASLSMLPLPIVAQSACPEPGVEIPPGNDLRNRAEGA